MTDRSMLWIAGILMKFMSFLVKIAVVIDRDKEGQNSERMKQLVQEYNDLVDKYDALFEEKK